MAYEVYDKGKTMVGLKYESKSSNSHKEHCFKNVQKSELQFNDIDGKIPLLGWMGYKVIRPALLIFLVWPGER